MRRGLVSVSRHESAVRQWRNHARMILGLERLGRALGVNVTVSARWGEVVLRIDDPAGPRLHWIAATPVGVDMQKVAAANDLIDRICKNAIGFGDAQSQLAAIRHLPPVSLARFVLLTAAGAAALGVIFGAGQCRPMAYAWPYCAQRRRWRPAAAMAGCARQQSVRTAVWRRSAGRPRRCDCGSLSARFHAPSGRRLPLHGARARAAFPQRCDRPRAHARRTRSVPDRLCQSHHPCHQRWPIGRPFTRRPRSAGFVAGRDRPARL
jgi:Putative threonine/serine exporter